MQEHSEIAAGRRVASRTRRVEGTDVREIREATGLSQKQFAELLNVELPTLRNWEQGRRSPTGPARALLKVFKARPAEVLEALSR